MPDRLMVGHIPLKDIILVRIQVWQHVEKGEHCSIFFYPVIDLNLAARTNLGSKAEILDREQMFPIRAQVWQPHIEHDSLILCEDTPFLRLS